MITGQPRSATIRAEAPTVLYVLSVKAFERMKIDQPTLAQALLSYVIRVMAERLSVTSRSLSIQQRISELAEVSEAIWRLER